MTEFDKEIVRRLQEQVVTVLGAPSLQGAIDDIESLLSDATDEERKFYEGMLEIFRTKVD